VNHLASSALNGFVGFIETPACTSTPLTTAVFRTLILSDKC